MGGVLAAAAIGGAIGGGSGAVLYQACCVDEEERRRRGWKDAACMNCTACTAGAAGGIACLPLHSASALLGGGSMSMFCELHRACGANVATGFVSACQTDRRPSDGAEAAAAKAAAPPATPSLSAAGGIAQGAPSTPLVTRLRRPPSCSYSASLPGLFVLPQTAETEDPLKSSHGRPTLCHWTPPPPDAESPPLVAALYLHSAEADLGSCVDECADIAGLIGGPVVAVEYEGYGLSRDPRRAGATSMLRDSVDAAAASALEWMERSLAVPRERIIVVGRFDGCGPAVALAAANTGTEQRGIGGLVLIDPVATAQGGKVEGWATLSLVRRTKCPLLLLAAAEDKTHVTDAEWLFVAASAAHVKGEGTLIRYYVPGKGRGELDTSDCAHAITGPFLAKVISRAQEKRISAMPAAPRPPPLPKGLACRHQHSAGAAAAAAPAGDYAGRA